MLVDRPELDPIGVGLLEVVPDELVDLGELAHGALRASRQAARAARARASFGSES